MTCVYHLDTSLTWKAFAGHVTALLRRLVLPGWCSRHAVFGVDGYVHFHEMLRPVAFNGCLLQAATRTHVLDETDDMCVVHND